MSSHVPQNNNNSNHIEEKKGSPLPVDAELLNQIVGNLPEEIGAALARVDPKRYTVTMMHPRLSNLATYFGAYTQVEEMDKKIQEFQQNDFGVCSFKRDLHVEINENNYEAQIKPIFEAALEGLAVNVVKAMNTLLQNIAMVLGDATSKYNDCIFDVNLFYDHAAKSWVYIHTSLKQTVVSSWFNRFGVSKSKKEVHLDLTVRKIYLTDKYSILNQENLTTS